MDRKKLVGPMILALLLGIGLTTASLSGCVSVGGGQGVELIENMSEASFTNLRLYVSLTTKVTASRLIAENLVSAEDVSKAVQAIDIALTSPVIPGASSILKPALEEVGLTGSEIELLLLIVERELLDRGALQVGVVELSPRTKELLQVISAALHAAVNEVVTPEELQELSELE